MSTISNNPDNAVGQILNIIRSKNIEYKHRMGTYDYYELFDGLLVLENHNIGRSNKGLFTTNNNVKNVRAIYLHNILEWNEPFGRSKKRYQYNTLGKSISKIEEILDIAKNVYKLNKQLEYYKN